MAKLIPLSILVLFSGLAWSGEHKFVPPKVSRCNIKIVRAKVLNQFEGKYLPMDLDVGFVLTVEFMDDCEVLNKKAGDTAHLGLHSIIKTFGDEFGDVTGQVYSVDVTRMFIRGKLRLHMRRVLSARAIGDDPPEEEKK